MAGMSFGGHQRAAMLMSGILVAAGLALVFPFGASAGNYEDSSYYDVHDASGAEVYVGQLFDWDDWVGQALQITQVGAYANVISTTATFDCVWFEYDPPFGSGADGWAAESSSDTYSNTPAWYYHNWLDDPNWTGSVNSTGNVQNIAGWGTNTGYCSLTQSHSLAATEGYIAYESNTTGSHYASWTNGP